MSITDSPLRKAALALIDRLYDKISESENGECEDCPQRREHSQRHPYGATYATETWYECECDEAKNCPEVEKLLSEALLIVSTKEKT